jgi:hypothetical protein
MNKLLYLFLIILFLFSACNSKEDKTLQSEKIFKIEDISLADNFSEETIFMDYEDAIDGFVIPSERQTENGCFDLSFRVMNSDKSKQELFYKIYYQNESYKFQEYDAINNNNQHEYAHENFYGSWEDTDIGFKSAGELDAGQGVEITDVFRIVGNPRNEQQFFYKDNNDRWKRNPRVGDYSFMLIITNKDDLDKMPDDIVYIHKKNNNNFSSPYFYFLYGEGKDLPSTTIFLDNKFINVKASPCPGNGVYINPYNFEAPGFDDMDKYFSENCSDCDEMYENAHFKQFVHYIDNSAKLYNIPIIQNIYDDLYTKTDYNWGRAFYQKHERIGILPMNPKYPCETVASDSINNKITIRNPGVEYGKWKKQNVGVITRHGFTYGKITVKANLTRLLNDDNVWNGITNAIWLINEGARHSDDIDWNLRRPCTKKGYMKTYWGGRDDDRVERVSYSEIDFEILKTVHYCPENKYPPVYENFYPDPNNIDAWNTPLPPDVLEYDNKIAVCCTNWDMACWQPENFSAGCHEVSYNSKKFLAHRWEDVYRAVTTKYMAPDKELFDSEYYYFQIDWQPDKIIWRIGPKKDELFIVGYIDQSISSIPNNQMLLIVTQEFHNTNWWPGSPYMQENIPFPKDDYTGEIFEVIIE